MRVLLVAHAFLPRSLAGVEVHVAELAAALARGGHDVAVFHGDRDRALPQGALRPGVVDGIPTFRFVQNYPYRDLPAAAVDPVAEARLREAIRAFRPDVVHFHHLAGLSAGAVAAARDVGTPAVLTLHDHFAACASGGQRWHPDGTVCATLDAVRCAACFARHRHREGPLEGAALALQRALPSRIPPDLPHRAFLALPAPAREALRRLNERVGGRAGARGGGARAGTGSPGGPERIRARWAAMRRALGAASAVISPSRSLADRTAEAGLAAGRIRVVGNGTALPPSRSPPPGAASPSRPLRALFLGTPAPHKGLEVLARAVASLPAGATELVVRGQSPFPDHLARCVGLAPDRIHYAGPAARDEVAAVLDEADVLCLPSLWWENAPMSLLEARARGRPTLASGVGGVPESVLDGVDGMLLPPGDAGAWARALGGLSSHRRALGALAATVRPPRSAAEHAREVLGVYHEVLG
ncbi:glycosyltransferase [Myxococcota bacterium]|nr:glycosyltransferase [Myxococcota bacterium]